MSAAEQDIEALAEEICQFIDKRSPFAFVSDPDTAKQRFTALRKRKLSVGVVEFSADCLPEARTALIAVLRRKGRTVSDVGNGRRMSPAMKAMYGKSIAAVEIGLDIPFVLKRAFIARIAGEERAQTACEDGDSRKRKGQNNECGLPDPRKK